MAEHFLLSPTKRTESDNPPQERAASPPRGPCAVSQESPRLPRVMTTRKVLVSGWAGEGGLVWKDNTNLFSHVSGGSDLEPGQRIAISCRGCFPEASGHCPGLPLMVQIVQTLAARLWDAELQYPLCDSWAGTRSSGHAVFTIIASTSLMFT